MTLFTSPMARQFVGFDTLFDELNKLSDRKEPNYPAYNIAKDDDEHYRIEVALAGFSADDRHLRARTARCRYPGLRFRSSDVAVH